ncbi:unnamed protein product [Moneuplotes crassus]|uniref:Uncharacterized protein n=1 Tax=Euplotes crassus TaxID=5936 RepID=A0AAD1XNY4_EUPCR|nr:unnamed protein product [Moneuplotes crassus]
MPSSVQCQRPDCHNDGTILVVKQNKYICETHFTNNYANNEVQPLVSSQDLLAYFNQVDCILGKVKTSVKYCKYGKAMEDVKEFIGKCDGELEDVLERYNNAVGDEDEEFSIFTDLKTELDIIKDEMKSQPFWKIFTDGMLWMQAEHPVDNRKVDLQLDNRQEESTVHSKCDGSSNEKYSDDISIPLPSSPSNQDKKKWEIMSDNSPEKNKKSLEQAIDHKSYEKDPSISAHPSSKKSQKANKKTKNDLKVDSGISEKSESTTKELHSTNPHHNPDARINCWIGSKTSSSKSPSKASAKKGVFNYEEDKSDPNKDEEEKGGGRKDSAHKAESLSRRQLEYHIGFILPKEEVTTYLRDDIFEIDFSVEKDRDLVESLKGKKLPNLKKINLYNVPENDLLVKAFLKDYFPSKCHNFFFNTGNSGLISIENYMSQFEVMSCQVTQKICISNCAVTEDEMKKLLAYNKNKAGFGFPDCQIDITSEVDFSDALEGTSLQNLYFHNCGKEENSNWKAYPERLVYLINGLLKSEYLINSLNKICLYGHNVKKGTINKIHKQKANTKKVLDLTTKYPN